MSPKATLENRLSRLNEAARQTRGEQLAEELHRAFESRSNILAARAAEITARRGLANLTPLLVRRFDDFMTDPEKTDKGCTAKTAIARALNELNYAEAGLFLRGLRHVQMEPVYGGQVDTADQLRGECVQGLVRIGYEEAALEVAGLALDPCPAARRAAIRACVGLPGQSGELIARMKVLGGDEDAEVMSECFTALIRLSPARSVPFVARYLHASDPAVAESAALSIGESREPAAFGILREAYENVYGVPAHRRLMLPIALTRTPEAFEFLLQTIREQPLDLAAAALNALAVCACDEDRRQQARLAVEQRDDPRLAQLFAQRVAAP